MEYEQIIAERRDDVALLTLNRPDRLNVWTPRMSAELVDAITKANDDDGVGAIVVTGAGRGFCAGADIGGQFAAQLEGQPATDTPPSEAPRVDWVQFCRDAKPLVAAINGPSIGVGLTMVLPFDQLIAAEGAKLSARFVKMGLVPELASSHFLVARCGWGAASWLALEWHDDPRRRSTPHPTRRPRRSGRAGGRRGVGGGVGAGGQPGPTVAHDQGAAVGQCHRDRSQRRAEAGDRGAEHRVPHARASRSRHRVPREAPAQVPLTDSLGPMGRARHRLRQTPRLSDTRKDPAWAFPTASITSPSPPLT